jgi:ABC-2 type transport system permease protein
VTFINALRAEFAKLFTVRLWWILLIILIGYVGFMAATLAAVFLALPDLASTGGAPMPPIESAHLLVYSTASSIGYVFPVLLGALATTGEFRSQTLTPTFLATPRRGRVLIAKLVALGAVGVLYGVGALLGSVGVGASLLALLGGDPALDSVDAWALFGRTLIAMSLWAVIGVALGTLVRSQVAAIVVVLAFTQFLEPILRFGASIWEWTAEVGKFLPGAASDALVGSSVFTAFGTGSAGAVALEWWQGGLVLLAIAAISAALGYFVTWVKDVT